MAVISSLERTSTIDPSCFLRLFRNRLLGYCAMHYVYLMEHINCLCCCLGSYSLLFREYSLIFMLFIVSCFIYLVFHLVYCIFATVIVCHFLCSLMAFDCQEIKGLLTYLLL